MGCSIHVSVEVLVNGKWEWQSEGNFFRSYDLFAQIADVRNDGGIVPISEPRGLPGDVTETTLVGSEEWGADGHNHSWLCSKEIKLVEQWIEPLDDWKWKDFGLVDDWRIVFWFDG